MSMNENNIILGAAASDPTNPNLIINPLLRKTLPKSYVSLFLQTVEQCHEVYSRQKRGVLTSGIVLDIELQYLQSWLKSLKEEYPSAVQGNTVVYLVELTKYRVSSSIRRLTTCYGQYGALIMLWSLLIKSKVAREIFHDILQDFLSAVHNNNSVSVQNAENFSDSVNNLLILMRNTYGRFYPRFEVAIRYLESSHGLVVPEQQLNNTSKSNKNNNNAVLTIQSMRNLRDEAIELFDETSTRVKKSMSNCEDHFSMLVPRLGSEFNSKTTCVTESMRPDSSRNKSYGGDNDSSHNESEDDEWSDGEEDNHEEAVNRTLEAMQVHGQFVEIDVQKHKSRDHKAEIIGAVADDKSDAINKEMHRKMLGKEVQELSDTHLPLLNSWVNALSRADNMPAATSIPQIAMRFPKRAITLRNAMDLKSRVTATIAQANRLKILEKTSLGNNSGEKESINVGSLRLQWNKAVGNASSSVGVADNRRESQNLSSIMPFLKKRKRRQLVIIHNKQQRRLLYKP